MRIITQRRRRGLLAASAALATLGLAAQAGAQYAPYAGGQAPYGVAQPQYGAAGPQYGAPQQQQYGAATPNYAVQQRPANYGAAQPTYAPQQTAPAPTTPQYAAQGAYQGYQQGYQASPYGYQPPNYSAPRVAMNFQGGGAATPTPEALPMTPPAEAVPPGTVQGGTYIPQPTPASDNLGYGTGGYETYPAPAAGGPGCATGNCNTGAGYGGYGGYGAPCNAAPYGACDTYSTHGGMGGVLSKHAGCGYWFGGVYGLFMDRDNSNKYPLAFTAPSMPDGGYPPPSMNTVLTTQTADVGFQPGAEFRFGRACGGRVNSCDPCACDPCACACGPTWGFEGVYWTLFDADDETSYTNQTTSLRMYTMMPMYGLEYDDGTGYMPVNSYWDHAPPSNGATPVHTVTTVRTRTSLEVQNLELNLLRLGVCGGGLGGATYSGAYGAAANCAGGCDSCATCTPCAPCGPRYSCTAVCGFRWMQFDEDFMFGVNYYETANPANSGYLNYLSTVQNNLFGAQIGCNGMYRIGCKGGLHMNTLVGLYGNDVDVNQYMSSPTGAVRFIGTGENFNAQAGKSDVAMLGELRLGASYQCTCHCRVYGGWRLIGVTGIALATDQTPNAFTSGSQMAGYVNSNGSMILHGLQTGVEFNF